MSLTHRWIVTGFAVALLGGSLVLRAQSPVPAQPPAEPVDFVRDVEPILERNCYECHGRSKARGKLRLHSPDFISRGGNSGRVLVPGRGRDSELIKRLLDPNEEDRMPLDADPLPPETIARLQAWIDQGAPMPAGMATGGTEPDVEEHWAYLSPSRPELPAVTSDAWVRNPVDRFVLARLEDEGLSPSPEATRATLLR
ncbi:MAG: hypothetical protein H0U94_03415, partial [Acidobacteria bacterium]|nr:hypothetical protein [Acidobacteriota bacterium]